MTAGSANVAKSASASLGMICLRRRHGVSSVGNRANMSGTLMSQHLLADHALREFGTRAHTSSGGVVFFAWLDVLPLEVLPLEPLAPLFLPGADLAAASPLVAEVVERLRGAGFASSAALVAFDAFVAAVVRFALGFALGFALVARLRGAIAVEDAEAPGPGCGVGPDAISGAGGSGLISGSTSGTSGSSGVSGSAGTWGSSGISGTSGSSGR